jgi:hypothetical protein
MSKKKGAIACSDEACFTRVEKKAPLTFGAGLKLETS